MEEDLEGVNSRPMRKRYENFSFDDAEIAAGTPAKYSRQLFDENFAEARSIVRHNPEQDNFALASFYGNEWQQVASPNALRGIQSLINRERENINFDVRHGIRSASDGLSRLIALNAVQKTLNNEARERIRDFGKL